MTVALGVVAGYLAGRLCWIVLRPSWSVASLLRQNHRGHPVPTAAGVVLPATLVLVEGGRAVASAAGLGGENVIGQGRLAVLVTALGMGLLGVIDDLAGPGDVRGFAGHLRALARAQLTTGGLKLLGGAGVALTAVAIASGPDTSAGRLLADAALVALAANLGNLFDRGPGRVLKVGVASFLVLAVATAGASVLTGVAVVVGAAAALLVDDLHERLMLGDTGANVLGGVVGLGLVLACSPTTRLVALAVVAALNLVSEVVSFSRVIDTVPPLRALDRAGRRRS
jgi:UDP-N-acetylmuramyl pentapeptide phosphotransferase/UDP-N-acetylglucosamine-1-phosphate transferase